MYKSEPPTAVENIDEITKEFLEIELEYDVEENPMIDVILKNILNILNKWLTSTNKSLFNAAIVQIKSASDTYSRSLNK